MKKSKKEKKVIIHLITTLDLGGAESMLFKLLSWTKDRSIFQHHVISLTGYGAVGVELQKIRIPVTALNLNQTLKDLSALFKLYYLLKSYKPQILQTWLYHSDLIGLVMGRIARVARILWNVRCADVDFNRYSITTKWIFRLLAKLSSMPDIVIVNSIAGQTTHRSAGYRPRRWEIIPNGFDIDTFRPNLNARKKIRAFLGINNSAPVIGMVARFDPMKDHANFFYAANILSHNQPEARFVLVGDGISKENAKLMQLVEENKVSQRTYLLGKRTDIHNIYPCFDINTLTSYSEGFSNVIGEAMACGIPCVATDVGDSAHLIGNTGKTIPARQSSALAQAWLEMLTLPIDKKRHLSSMVRKRIAEQFSINTIAQRYEQIYMGLN